MNTAERDAGDILNRREVRHWLWYAAKAAALFLLLGVFAAFGAHMHALGVALVWVLLSCASALGCGYFRVVRKASQRFLFEPGRQLSRINSGRVLSFFLAFVAAAVCVTGLFFDVLRWDGLDWSVVASGAVFYPLAYFALHRLIGDQFSKGFRRAGVTRAAIWATIAYLCIAYFAASFASPAADYPTAYQAFAAAQRKFGDSPMELLRQIGMLSLLSEGMTNWSASQAAGASPHLYAALKIALSALSLAAMGSMLGACSISRLELRRMFADLPSETVDAAEPGSATAAPALRCRFAVAGACMPVLLLALILGMDANLQEASDRGELSIAQSFVRSAVNLTVYAIDGKAYDAQSLQAALDEAKDELGDLSSETKEALVPLVNSSFDARVGNIDGYLDDYYSLPADYERLASLIGGNVGEFAAQRLQEKLDSGVDDSELLSRLEEYGSQEQAIADRFEEAKASCEVEGTPEWLVTSKEALDSTFIDDALEPDQQLLSFEQRLGASAAAGAGVGITTKAVSKKVVERAVEKQFFKNVVARITSVLGSRATGGVVGAAIGTAAGPVGTVAGAAVGTAAGIGVDYTLLKVDESQNRDSYKAQIAQAIEDERAEMLSMLK